VPVDWEGFKEFDIVAQIFGSGIFDKITDTLSFPSLWHREGCPELAKDGVGLENPAPSYYRREGSLKVGKGLKD